MMEKSAYFKCFEKYVRHNCMFVCLVNYVENNCAKLDTFLCCASLSEKMIGKKSPATGAQKMMQTHSGRK